MRKYFYIYILANQRNSTLYVGVTNNLLKRVWEHKNKIFHGFTDKYNIDKLVYYEIFEDIREALAREKKLKKWNRHWKLELIEKENKNWLDLYDNLSQ